MFTNFTRTAIAIALGAIPGALGRYLITELTKAMIGENFSYYGTFLINMSGCLLIASFYMINQRQLTNLSPEIRLIFATGFCGAYTSFSSYGLETFSQIEQGQTTVALIYWLGSIIMGMVSIKLGVMLGNWNFGKKDQD